MYRIPTCMQSLMGNSPAFSSLPTPLTTPVFSVWSKPKGFLCRDGEMPLACNCTDHMVPTSISGLSLCWGGGLTAAGKGRGHNLPSKLQVRDRLARHPLECRSTHVRITLLVGEFGLLLAMDRKYAVLLAFTVNHAAMVM